MRPCAASNPAIGQALDAVETLVHTPHTEAEKSLRQEATKTYYGLINHFTCYTERNLKDLSRRIAGLDNNAHQLFVAKLLASDSSRRDILD